MHDCQGLNSLPTSVHSTLSFLKRVSSIPMMCYLNFPLHLPSYSFSLSSIFLHTNVLHKSHQMCMPLYETWRCIVDIYMYRQRDWKIYISSLYKEMQIYISLIYSWLTKALPPFLYPIPLFQDEHSGTTMMWNFPRKLSYPAGALLGRVIFFFFLQLLIFRLVSWCFGTVLSAYVTQESVRVFTCTHS